MPEAVRSDEAVIEAGGKSVIYIKSKQYGNTLNTSFFLMNGPHNEPLDRFAIGDRVSLMWPISAEKAHTLKETRDDLGYRVNAPITSREEWIVTIDFRVVDKCHGLLYDGEPGHLERLQTQVYLEPETGFAEDVFLWVAMGEQPAWVE